MSAIGPSGHDLLHCTCPLSEGKQTWPFARARFCGRYWGQSGHGVLQRKCLLMTHSGHPRGSNYRHSTRSIAHQGMLKATHYRHSDRKGPRRGTAMIRTTVLRALVLTAAFAAAFTP